MPRYETLTLQLYAHNVAEPDNSLNKIYQSINYKINTFSGNKYFFPQNNFYFRKTGNVSKNQTEWLSLAEDYGSVQIPKRRRKTAKDDEVPKN